MTDDFHDRATYVARYAEHSSRLQTWIGAYGAGLASALVYQFRTALGEENDSIKDFPWPSAGRAEGFARIDAMHMDLRSALMLIAFALAIQVLLLFLNKGTQFSLAHLDDDEKQWSWLDRRTEWLSHQYLIDMACDAGSIVLLALATFKAMRALGLS
jgi:hypothetical protein